MHTKAHQSNPFHTTLKTKALKPPELCIKNQPEQGAQNINVMEEISRARTANGRLIDPKEIQLITGMDLEACKREHKHIRQYLQTGSEDLLVSQYCQFYGLDYHEIISFLGDE